MSEFNERVYAIARQIPCGKVVSYGMLAMFAGKPRGARLAASAMMRCPDSAGVPCHRVIHSDGSLCDAHDFGVFQRESLLQEGVILDKNGRVNMGRYAWIGPDDLA